ncbi:oxidoreductase of aldo/keto reductase family, subgroup 1 [Labilithrix luteola]|uniref:Oxidoreductase of aldo/keto reductase family, subgroup 1 n=1 Tax=Labilithrix luteola TaxID=1391654 RepID=A0A0K1PME9_9BACT|nr:aldo/keto reductase [Labilithrix luteola]AKU94274.1 oxidoreductase of aldo/keto reductase family, subgroup 1 [Labilithrix luteola]
MANLDVTTATLPLRSGGVIPQVGLGVWQAPRGGVTRDAVHAALRLGYRHVDTARIYGNEAEVGEGIRQSGIPRAEVFVTTKLWNEDQGFDKALRAFDASLQRLGLDYVDLYLLHWPVAGRRLDSWRALERIKSEGRAKHIGVSNFLVPHLDELFDASKEVPEVNQIEIHPFLQHRETRALCAKHRIIVEAYSPLTHGTRMDDPTVQAVAREVSRTPAQVLLRWGVQHGLVTLPKSTREQRIAENGAIFDFSLSEDAMKRLDALEEGCATGWDPRDQR